MARQETRSKTEMVEALRAAGYRITRQRVLIIEALAGRGDHPSAQQIHEDLSHHDPPVSLATVYNTLATMVRASLVVEMDFEADNNRFDTNLRPHLNLVCLSCGAILDVAQDLPVAPESIQRRHGFLTHEIRMEYRGRCSSCRNKEKNRRA